MKQSATRSNSLIARSGMAQQQGTGIRGDRPAVETRDHATVLKGVKFELSGATVCLHRALLLKLSSLCC